MDDHSRAKKDHLESDLLRGPWTIAGSAGKLHVLHDVRELIRDHPRAKILDVGCVGLKPLEFWEPLLATEDFLLTGTDVQGIDRGQAVVEQQGWEEKVSIQLGSGYELDQLFPKESFDAVVATQVLEHVAQLNRFLQQLERVLKPGGQVFLLYDSAHFLSRYAPSRPGRLVKNVAKRFLASLGRELHYDLPWTAEEVVQAAIAVGFENPQVSYHNLHPLKYLHNHVVERGKKNEFLRHWSEIELQLNTQDLAAAVRHYFMGVYVRATKR